jgi:thiamine pyrophosphate-dependent acetolactate synthase large subunit-like protein
VQAPTRDLLQPPDADAVRGAAKTLRALGERALLLVGAAGVSERGAALAAAIARKTGCRVMTEFYSPRTPGGRGRTRIERLPYAVDAAVDKLKGAECLVLAGASDPISFFAYPGKPSQLKPPGCSIDAGRRARRRAGSVTGSVRRTRRHPGERGNCRCPSGTRRVARGHHFGCRRDWPRLGRAAA